MKNVELFERIVYTYVIFRWFLGPIEKSAKFVESPSYFSFRVRIMKCRVRIVIVSVVVGFILEYNH